MSDTAVSSSPLSCKDMVQQYQKKHKEFDTALAWELHYVMSRKKPPEEGTKRLVRLRQEKEKLEALLLATYPDEYDKVQNMELTSTNQIRDAWFPHIFPKSK